MKTLFIMLLIAAAMVSCTPDEIAPAPAVVQQQDCWLIFGISNDYYIIQKEPLNTAAWNAKRYTLVFTENPTIETRLWLGSKICDNNLKITPR